jgi:hypothetical protein
MEINIEQNIFYNYKALDLLINNIDEYVIDNNIKNIKIIAYGIKNNNKYPYNLVGLFKNLHTNTLSFPELEFDTLELNSEKIIMLTKINLFGVCHLDDYDNFEKNACFRGFYLNNDETYIFVDLSECNIQTNFVLNKSTIWFCLIDEIMNHNNVCNYLIDQSVISFFNCNVDFCFLKDKQNNSYEIPCVGYVGINTINTNINNINFIYQYGVLKKDYNSILGPYYYFTDYKNSIQQSEQNNIKIVRFALFLGKIKVIENFSNDKLDKSIIKNKRLLDPNLDNILEELTIRITDYDGKWVEKYDSVFVGEIKLENDEYLKNTPIIVVKEYEQQIPLSYHYIN